MGTRRPNPSMTEEEQASELAKIDAEIDAVQGQAITLSRRLEELRKRRVDVKTRLVRERLQGVVGQFVKLTSTTHWMAPKSRLKPMEGDIGRLLKVGRTRALIDFGDELHTWYVALPAIGTVQDPLTKSFEALAQEDAERRWWARLEEGMDGLSGIDEEEDEDGAT
jgi:hypothetical protein